MLKMQVADAQRPLISQHENTGQSRDNNVYRMEVETLGMPTTDFAWQGE